MPERIATSAAASICGYSAKTLRRYAQAGLVPGAMRLDDNADWRFDEAKLRRWIARREAEACRAISTSAKAPGAPASRFTAAIARAAITLTRTKTNRPRTVPLDERASRHIAGTPPMLGCPYLFWHGQGDRYRNVASRFAAIAKRAPRRFRFHDLRHWFAVDYLRRGGGIYQLQQILGHSSLKTTEIYLAYLTPDEAEAAKGTRG